MGKLIFQYTVLGLIKKTVKLTTLGICLGYGLKYYYDSKRTERELSELRVQQQLRLLDTSESNQSSQRTQNLDRVVESAEYKPLSSSYRIPREYLR
jgi:hypothetical protein